MSDGAGPGPGVGSNTWGRQRRSARQRRAVVTTIVVALCLATFVVVTGQTGFPGPGALRRYPTADLQDLADRINHGGDCASFAPDLPVASVDWVRSRVHLERPHLAVVAQQDRPLIDNPPVGATGVGPVSGVRCVGHSLAG
ncbi:MAG: hypothetical protein ACXWB2_00545 [Acidimicrobiales bacterium]